MSFDGLSEQSELISPQYREQNRLLHERTDVKYGARGHRHVREVLDFAQRIGAKDVLDYGCGKGTLSIHLSLPCLNYDPCVPKFDTVPTCRDLVVCTDVLEHIEPEKLHSVLSHISRLARKGVFFVIACRVDSTKTLPDGSNPHKIVKDGAWWESTLSKYFRILASSEVPGKEYRAEAVVE